MPVDYSGRNMPGFTKKKPRDYKKCEAGDYFRFFGDCWHVLSVTFLEMNGV